MSQNERGEAMFKVVVNIEGQYSLWSTIDSNPLGWSDEGFVGNKEACLAHIANVWQDMRPLSLQRKMTDMPIETDTRHD